MGLIAAVIPAFRPDAAALADLVAHLAAAGVTVLVVDDASPCTSDVALRTAREQGAEVIVHSANRGIARSLNDGLRFARERGATWLLTVDQDSSLGEGFVPRLRGAAEDAVADLGPRLVGAVAPLMVDDASGEITYPVREVRGQLTTEEVMQSGTLWSVDALSDIDGFDERLGIDAVDAAACVRLRASGRRIVLARGLSIGHRMGDSRVVSLFGRRVLSTGHGPERRRTIIRNRLALAPEEFRQSPRHAARTLRRVLVGTLLAVTVEEDRWPKAKASLAGLLPSRSR